MRKADKRRQRGFLWATLFQGVIPQLCCSDQILEIEGSLSSIIHNGSWGHRVAVGLAAAAQGTGDSQPVPPSLAHHCSRWPPPHSGTCPLCSQSLTVKVSAEKYSSEKVFNLNERVRVWAESNPCHASSPSGGILQRSSQQPNPAWPCHHWQPSHTGLGGCWETFPGVYHLHGFRGHGGCWQSRGVLVAPKGLCSVYFSTIMLRASFGEGRKICISEQPLLFLLFKA